jgi:peptidoglycan/LPS O-acetylase OafA/YrhL
LRQAQHAAAAYRSDIDGLRAIAVLFVVAFHAFPKYFPGGFVGVDIFFVISGFLISRLIYLELHENTFSILRFYVRRIKRIFPALITVLIACALVGGALLLPGEYQLLGKHVAGGAGFFSNFLLLGEAGYFDDAAESKPLLHLWSLGIEEQFYLVWPAIILLCAWRKLSPLIAAIAICIGSFAWNLALSVTDLSAAFYLPMSRFWELMVGCILAWTTITPERRSGGSVTRLTSLASLDPKHLSKAATVLAFLGVVLVVIAVVITDKTVAFPGWYALLPSLGAAMLIAAVPSVPVLNRLLSYLGLVYVGLISYPLYLWHWPILSYLRIMRIQEPTHLMKAAAIGAAFALAALTCRFIERPIRFGARGPLKPIASAAALALAGCTGLWIYVSEGLPARNSPQSQAVVKSMQAVDQWVKSQSFGDRCAHLERGGGVVKICQDDDGGHARRIFLWGDSYAWSLYAAFTDSQRRIDNFDLSAYSALGCPPVLRFKGRSPGTSCVSFNDMVFERIRERKPDITVMIGRWEWYRDATKGILLNEDEIRSTIAHLASVGAGRVVVVGQLPVWSASPWAVRAREARTEPLASLVDHTTISFPTREKRYVQPVIYEVDAWMKKAVEGTGAVFVSPLPTFCNEEGCLLVAGKDSDYPLAADAGGHLTPEGAQLFAAANSRSLFGK